MSRFRSRMDGWDYDKSGRLIPPIRKPNPGAGVLQSASGCAKPENCISAAGVKLTPSGEYPEQEGIKP